NYANASTNTVTPATKFVTSGTITGLSGADTGNYKALNLGTIGTNTATINAVDYTAIIGAKPYDGTVNFSNVALTGVNSESFNVATATSNYANASTNTVTPATKFVTSGTITGLSGADTGNYKALN